MTCKDCVHCEACEGTYRYYDDEYINEVSFSGDVRDLCHTFKNKADVVEVVRCKDCKQFMEYSDAYKRAVERADGDCFLRHTHSYDEQFIACRYNDFCSYGERRNA